ncbi:MAG: MgtC/SapB family protein [Candidatus Omnitrophica bacterium]|nr:MgtC/SapB family protein [Candidatus Omnitrophota bacterium]
MLSDYQIILRLLLSVFLGGLIGLERQFKRRNAGLRTHILVTMGSCLIMLTSLYVFDIYKDKADPSRIAAGVITGIGFLGAGTIMRDTEGVRGLTTAASLWVASAIGLAVGVGFIRASFVATVISLIVLFLFRHFEKRVFSEDKHEHNS